MVLRTSARVWVTLLLLPVAAAAAGWSVPLAEAVKHRDLEAVRALLQQHVGASLNVKNKKGYTPLQLAVGGVGMLGSYRPEAGTLLRKAMIARGLPPEVKVDENKYSFGVAVK
jgi:hypothetical protein